MQAVATARQLTSPAGISNPGVQCAWPGAFTQCGAGLPIAGLAVLGPGEHCVPASQIQELSLIGSSIRSCSNFFREGIFFFWVRYFVESLKEGVQDPPTTTN